MSRRIASGRSRSSVASSSSREVDVASAAMVSVTSEEVLFPIDYVFDDQRGPGGSCWIAADGGEQIVVVAFDAAHALRSIRIEVEEHGTARGQHVALSISCDSGASFQELMALDFAFTPYGATFQEATRLVALEGVTHVCLRITPTGGLARSAGAGRASLTSIALR